MGEWRRRFGGCVIGGVVLCAVLSSQPAVGELYMAGQVGLTLPNSVSSVEGTGRFAGLSFSGGDLQTSVMYGAKMGYYFDSIKWLGVETEVFNTTPHPKQGNVTIGGVPAGTPRGAYWRVLTWAPVNVVARYQMGRFEPYAGIGAGVFFFRAHDGQSGESTSSTRVGLNTQLGGRYKLGQHLALFGEWKFNWAPFHFSETPALIGIKGDYSAHILVLGLGYHF